MKLLVLIMTTVIMFENIRNDKGSIKYLVFDNEEGYPDNLKQSIRSGTISTKEAEKGFALENLQVGSYAISVIHDENDNDKLDTNFLGIPKEGFGFSNNATVLFGPPSFNKTKVEINKDSEIIIKMKYF